MKNTNKFLVTWVEGNGFIRGQATKTAEEADRMFSHITSGTDASYAEVRKIGPLVKHWSRPIPPHEVQ